MSSRSYTLAELEELSGFNARTIVYYIAEGLLPKVGRRGRHTRYAEDVLLRLQFIRRVRGLQDAGRLRPVTLSEIRDVINSLEPGEMRELAAEDSDEEAIRALFEEPDAASVAGQPYAAAEEIAADRSRMLSVSARLAQRRRRQQPESAIFEFAMPHDMMSEDEMPGRTPVGRASQGTDRAEAFADDGAGESESEPLRLLLKKGLEAEPQAPASDQDRQLLAELKSILMQLERQAREARVREGSSERELVVRLPLSEHIALTLRNVREDDELIDRLTEILRRLRR